MGQDREADQKSGPAVNPPMFYDTICILSVTSFMFSPSWELNTLFREVLTACYCNLIFFRTQTHHYLGT